MLKGRCRRCDHSISWLYPFIELLTATVLTFLYATINLHYFPAYFIFFSALIVTIRSDIQSMLISRFVTLFLIPLGIIFSFFGFLPISGSESIFGALSSFLFLYGLARTFYLLTGKEGMGEGDFELLAFIGAFVGFFGSLIILFCASIIGSFFGLVYILIAHAHRSAKIPFGPFLALAAIAYVFFQDFITHFLIIC